MAETVFLSHSTKDVQLARALIAQLEQRGLSIWMAPDEIRGGEYYGERLMSAISTCDAFLLLASKHSIGTKDESFKGSEHVLREMDTAMDESKTLIPLDVDGRQEQGFRQKFAYPLKLRQYIDLRGAVATGNFTPVCDLIVDAVRGSSASAPAKAPDPLSEIEASLKKGNYSSALNGLAAVGIAPNTAERAELLKIVAQLQRTPISDLNKATADALGARLVRLCDSDQQPAALYVLGALSVHFYQAFHMFDQTGDVTELKARAKASARMPAKYSIMMSHALPKRLAL